MHTRLLLSATTLLLVAPLWAQSSKTTVDFQKQILPILEKNCAECHSAPHAGSDGRMRKPKGGVMFDSPDGIKQGKKGKVVIAKKPDDSLLYTAISLPADDEDRMPPAKHGDPLSKEQQDLIKKWIEEGASFGSWKGKPAEEKPKEGDGKGKGKGKESDKPKDKSKGDGKGKEKGETIAAAREDLERGLAPVAESALAALANSPFQVASIGEGSPLLRVNCAGRTDDVDDRALQALAPIADHVTDLDLARSAVTDAGCAVLAKMTRLTHLDLRQTQVGNPGVASLGPCTELRSLNLFGTHTGDYALAALQNLPHLENLYLWQTEASAEAAVRLRDAVPGLRVVMVAELPEPMPEGSQQKRRGR